MPGSARLPACGPISALPYKGSPYGGAGNPNCKTGRENHRTACLGESWQDNSVRTSNRCRGAGLVPRGAGLVPQGAASSRGLGVRVGMGDFLPLPRLHPKASARKSGTVRGRGGILPLCAHVLYRAFEKYKCQGSTPRDNDSFWNGVQTSVFVQSPPGDSEHGQLRENW